MTRPAAKTNAFSTETKATPDRPQSSRTPPAATEMQKESAATCRPDNAELQERLDAANKSYTLMNDKMQKLFESSMTKSQGHLDLANSALTATGNRGSRVELVSNRLAKQQTNFKTLSSENEEVDITEVTVNLRSVELAYNASLMATGKIAQTTLLNYL